MGKIIVVPFSGHSRDYLVTKHSIIHKPSIINALANNIQTK